MFQVFVAHFSYLKHDFQDDYRVLYNGIPRHAESWPAVIGRAQKATIRLHVLCKT